MKASAHDHEALDKLKLDLSLKFPSLDLETGLLKSEHTDGIRMSSPFAPGVSWQLGAGYSDIMRYGDPARPSSLGHFQVHGGLDFRVPAGTNIYAVRSGLVKQIKYSEGTSKKHISLQIEEWDEQGHFVGRSWHYAHIELASIPPEFLLQDVPVKAGSYIGQVVKWWENDQFIPDQLDISDQQRYDHLHIFLNANDGDKKSVYFNPTRFFIQQDLIPPKIDRITYSVKGPKDLKTQMPTLKRGDKLSLYVEAHDKLNDSPFKLGIKSIQVKIASLFEHTEEAGPKIVYENFFQLENIIQTYQVMHQDIMPAIEQVKVDGKLLSSQWDRFRKQIFFEVTANWDTALHKPGTYLITIEVSDEFGNLTSQENTIKIID